MINAAEAGKGRAGRYVQQPEGYRAFVPAALPPDPPVDLGGHLRELLSEADYALGRLDGAVLTLPSPDVFVFMYVRKEAVLSSQIEGTQSSLQNLLAAEARLADPDAPADVAEVINYVRAMNHGLARLADLPVSVKLIREIHAQLMQGVRGGRLGSGELRTSQNWLGPGAAPSPKLPSFRRRRVTSRRPSPTSSAFCTPRIRPPPSCKSGWRTRSSRPSTPFSTATAASGGS